jgi:hypothetical protein
LLTGLKGTGSRLTILMVLVYSVFDSELPFPALV